jgi:folate-dependent tRNA-U54 methylase TrmFO/GidA
VSGQDIVNALHKTRRDLLQSVENWRTYGIALAGAERAYRVANSKMIMRLHDERKVAWTAAGDLSRGMEAVESLRFARDVAKVHYDAEAEKINVLKIEVRNLESEAQEGLRGYRGK